MVSFRFDELPKDDEKWGFVELSKRVLDLLKECRRLCKGIMAMGKTIGKTKTTMNSTTTSLFLNFFGNNSIWFGALSWRFLIDAPYNVSIRLHASTHNCLRHNFHFCINLGLNMHWN